MQIRSEAVDFIILICVTPLSLSPDTDCNTLVMGYWNVVASEEPSTVVELCTPPSGPISSTPLTPRGLSLGKGSYAAGERQGRHFGRLAIVIVLLLLLL